MDQHATWYGGRPRPWPHCVGWGPSAPSPEKGGTAAPTFRPMYCGETAGWISIPLGMEVALGPVHIMLDGDLAHPKGHNSPQFATHVYCGQTAI